MTDREGASELEYLKYCFQNADFGPAQGDVMYIINQRFKAKTGKLLPADYAEDYDDE